MTHLPLIATVESCLSLRYRFCTSVLSKAGPKCVFIPNEKAEHMEKERRKFIRHHLECPATMVTFQKTLVGQTSNFSGDGAFICCKQPLTPGGRIEVSIRFPDGFFMEVPAEVVWSRNPGSDDKQPCGMGVRFLW